ncbi:ccaat-box binding factor hap3 [Stylonychia lemnae]|uniref:Ccaat-box binding factor hap3 n=1 Tax=Stylonychia lemnae TaxID=5949 RepID=A0A078AAH2_STYLE|nr:ccaat-box binding factor hap3 [Stylonychia lemnae]|eukprot:CDW79199.1 ccaat-box binding factor hap3 [Stylonychia lemnae]
MDKGGDDDNKEQDRYLPIANIGRIMKQALPKDAKIAKEARETVQECVSEFISFITSEACDKCKNDKRKTINGEDLIYSLYQLGFERYLENLNLYYQKYKDAQKHNDKGDLASKNNEMLVNSAQEAVQQSKQNKNGLNRVNQEEDEDADEDDIDDEEEDEDMEDDDQQDEDDDMEEDETPEIAKAKKTKGSEKKDKAKK